MTAHDRVPNVTSEMPPVTAPAPDATIPHASEPDSDLPPADARHLDVFDPLFLAVRLQWLYDHVPDPLTGDRFTDASLAERVGQVTKGRITISAPGL